MSRPLLLALLLALLTAPAAWAQQPPPSPPAAIPPPPPGWTPSPVPPGEEKPPPKPKPVRSAPAIPRSWAWREIGVVTRRGLLGGDAAAFRPREALTRGELGELVAALAETPARTAASPEAHVSLALLDAALVSALDLRETAARFHTAAESAGLEPPSRFGTEVVARLLGLRKNHEGADERLELEPSRDVSRAEAAYSAAQILRLEAGKLERTRAAARSFAVPTLTPRQRQVLRTATALVGYPYVWGGASERAQGPYPAGGFDCSGFVWRVYKSGRYPGAERLTTTLRGRSTYSMSGEFPKGERIPRSRLAPADLLFFGLRGTDSRPNEVDHMGIYLGNGWILHAGGRGVTLTPLEDWYRERFAWGRRPLAEAGL